MYFLKASVIISNFYGAESDLVRQIISLSTGSGKDRFVSDQEYERLIKVNHTTLWPHIHVGIVKEFL